MNRREFLGSTVAAVAVGSLRVPGADPLPDAREWAEQSPLKIAHREGNMLRTSSPGVYELASKIPGCRTRILDSEGHYSLIIQHCDEVLKDLMASALPG